MIGITKIIFALQKSWVLSIRSDSEFITTIHHVFSLVLGMPGNDCIQVLGGNFFGFVLCSLYQIVIAVRKKLKGL